LLARAANTQGQIASRVEIRPAVITAPRASTVTLLSKWTSQANLVGVPVPPDAHWEAYLLVKAIRDIASGLLTAIMAWRNKNLLWHSRGNSWCHGNYQRHAVVGIIGRSSAPPRANCAWSWNLPVEDWR
jgi:hypothetical protein